MKPTDVLIKSVSCGCKFSKYIVIENCMMIKRAEVRSDNANWFISKSKAQGRMSHLQII